MSISHDFSRSCLNALLLKQNQEKKKKHTRKIYGDTNCDLCFCWRCHCCASFLCSDWSFKRPFKISYDFKWPLNWSVNTYQCNSDEMKEGKIIITTSLIKERLLSTNDNSLLHLPASSCSFEPPLLGNVQYWRNGRASSYFFGSTTYACSVLPRIHICLSVHTYLMFFNIYGDFGILNFCHA